MPLACCSACENAGFPGSRAASGASGTSSGVRCCGTRCSVATVVEARAPNLWCCLVYIWVGVWQNDGVSWGAVRLASARNTCAIVDVRQVEVSWIVIIVLSYSHL